MHDSKSIAAGGVFVSKSKLKSGLGSPGVTSSSACAHVFIPPFSRITQFIATTNANQHPDPNAYAESLQNVSNANGIPRNTLFTQYTYILRQNSRSSTSSGSSKGSGGAGLRRKPTPVEMFLKA
ncbi:hypothetical protein DFJ58DRAFT_729906 [Suillus subalutaceus]|uniref:uncharacterized protein n=1 Tax=Suillus subalutaceus TaxID=48586 RepID=UPI001B8799DB|nr:uncharacterized protein DFJ58DRAFT_729906 [Suillus subalutaceus]KAG1848319.1 hypothetical protein DFJ58DRAFT_729906 [Suillus subalutaceus]